MNKSLIAAAALIFSTQINAAQVDVDGITFNAGAFDMQISNLFTQVFSTGSTLSGIGVADAINSNPFASVPSVELTYILSGFDFAGSTSIFGTTGGTKTTFYNNGMINFYADIGTEPDLVDTTQILNPNVLNDGTLWLSLAVNGFFDALEAVDSNGDITTDGIINWDGEFDVVGGSAANAFDTNTTPRGADLLFAGRSSTTAILSEMISFGWNSVGEFNLTGSTVDIPHSPIPEPTMLALILIGLGLMKVKKST